MSDNDARREELAHFDDTLGHIDRQLDALKRAYVDAEDELQKYMYSSWEDGAHMGASIDRLIEAVQIGKYVKTQEILADKRMEKIDGLTRLKASPYFARTDFTERGNSDVEKIYIGRHALFDETNRQPIVYDWRAPISSIFYRFERGPVYYDAPVGRVEGDVSLKRQYEIKNGKFEYFFDADVRISDEFLRKMLSQNASSRMKTIVETIQKEQDVIIRDAENELLIVQGVAGSGKTSIALHRVAYLMYEGLSSRLSAHDIVIISPNTLFESYISSVLPELGEQNITTLEFETIARDILGELAGEAESRNAFLEAFIKERDPGRREAMKRDIRFKTSEAFAAALQKYRDKCLANADFTDVVRDGTRVASAEELRRLLTRREDRNSSESRLARARELVYGRLRASQADTLKALAAVARQRGEGDTRADERVWARVESLRQCAAIRRQVEDMTRLNYRALYEKLVTDKSALAALMPGVGDAGALCAYSRAHLDFARIGHADALAFAYFVMLFRGASGYAGIKQVVVDEAQDYYPLQYEMLRRLFPRARWTVLGDVNQTIGKLEDEGIYASIEKILSKRKSVHMTMKKSFRCTNQIIAFSSRFIDERFGLVSFNRDGEEPRVLDYPDEDAMIGAMPGVVQAMREKGCGSVAVITRSSAEAAALYARLDIDGAKLIPADRPCELTGVMVLPVYMAKGLEFDGVVVYDASAARYRDEDDKRLLYIASTRALHNLAIVCAGEPSAFLKEGGAHV